MESAKTTQIIISFIYLAAVVTSLFVLQPFLLSGRLTVSLHKITVKKLPQLPLLFRSDGTFKILQVADVHYGNGLTRCRDVLPSEFERCSDLNSTKFLERMIEAEKPDFVAFTGAPGSHLANCSVLNLFFLDSGDRATVDGVRTYGWIKESQLSWLREASKAYQEDNRDGQQSEHISLISTAPPALAFFHIPIPEIRQGPFRQIVGTYQEYVACSLVNSGVLQTLTSIGDIKAVFIGHDHTNDFCGLLDEIWFCYGGGFGYHGYGKAGWPRRARVILAELGKGKNAWVGVETIKTWKRLDDGNLSKVDEQVLWSRLS